MENGFQKGFILIKMPLLENGKIIGIIVIQLKRVIFNIQILEQMKIKIIKLMGKQIKDIKGAFNEKKRSCSSNKKKKKRAKKLLFQFF